jgi:ParB/RepB/Spo0J family partition protein
MTEKRKLGKGLDALLSVGSTETMASLLDKPKGRTFPAASTDKDGDLKNIPLDLIQRGKYQPRTDMHEEALEELANSIKAQGVMQPIVIRPITSNRYEIIAGERRWRACQIAGLDTIPALIKSVGDEAAIAMSLIENIQRENLNPIEEAMALKRLQDEFELTQQVRQTESLVRRLIARAGTANENRPVDPDIKNLEENLADKLGAKVMIQHTAKGKGRLILKYNSLDELDGILSHIN